MLLVNEGHPFVFPLTLGCRSCSRSTELIQGLQLQVVEYMEKDVARLGDMGRGVRSPVQPVVAAVQLLYGRRIVTNGTLTSRRQASLMQLHNSASGRTRSKFSSLPRNAIPQKEVRHL